MKKINLILIFLFGVISSNICFATIVGRHIYNNSSFPAYVRFSNDSAPGGINYIGDANQCSNTQTFGYCEIPEGGAVEYNFSFLENEKQYFRIYYSLNPDFENAYMGGDDISKSWILGASSTRTSEVMVCGYDIARYMNCWSASNEDDDPNGYLYNSFQRLKIEGRHKGFMAVLSGHTAGDIEIQDY